MLTKEQLALLKKQLEATLQSLSSEISTDEKVTDFGSDVESTEDLPEETDEAEEFSTNAGIAQTLRIRREAVEHAIQKIHEGKYGSCEKCSTALTFELLRVDPESRYCQPCKLKL